MRLKLTCLLLASLGFAACSQEVKITSEENGSCIQERDQKVLWVIPISHQENAVSCPEQPSDSEDD